MCWYLDTSARNNIWSFYMMYFSASLRTQVPSRWSVVSRICVVKSDLYNNTYLSALYIHARDLVPRCHWPWLNMHNNRYSPHSFELGAKISTSWWYTLNGWNSIRVLCRQLCWGSYHCGICRILFATSPWKHSSFTGLMDSQDIIQFSTPYRSIGRTQHCTIEQDDTGLRLP